MLINYTNIWNRTFYFLLMMTISKIAKHSYKKMKKLQNTSRQFMKILSKKIKIYLA